MGGCYLAMRTPTDLTDDILTIQFPREGDVKGFLASGYEKNLTDAILEVAGFRVRIVPLARSSASPTTHPTDALSREPQNIASPSDYSDEQP